MDNNEYEDEGCYEYLQVMNSGDSFNEMIYDQLLNAIPDPKSEYCRWVIDQFLMRQFSLNEVNDVRQNLELYIDEIGTEFPAYYLELVEELDNVLHYVQDDQEEEEDEDEPYIIPTLKKKLSDLIQSKKSYKQQR